MIARPGTNTAALRTDHRRLQYREFNPDAWGRRDTARMGVSSRRQCAPRARAPVPGLDNVLAWPGSCDGVVEEAKNNVRRRQDHSGDPAEVRRGGNRPLDQPAEMPPSSIGLPWGVLTGAWLVFFVNFGAAYSVAVTFPEVQIEFDMPPWHLGAMFSITGCLYYGLGLLTGPATDRYGVRPFIVAGQLIMAAGLLLASIAHSEARFATAYFLAIGVGLGISYTPLTAVGPIYCPNRTGTSSSIVISGIGAGTLIVPATCSMLMQTFGWRTTMGTLGCFALVALIGALPLTPVARVPLKSSAQRTTAELTSTTKRFWHLYSGLALSAIVMFVPFAHIIPYVISLGRPVQHGALLIGLIGLGSLLGRLGLGLVADRCGSCRATSLCTFEVGLSFLLFSTDTAFWPIACGAVLFGTAYGGFSTLTAPAAIEVLGREGVAKVLGRLNTSRAIGILAGPWSVGFLARNLGGYQFAFVVCAAVACVASFLLLAVTKPASGAIP